MTYKPLIVLEHYVFTGEATKKSSRNSRNSSPTGFQNRFFSLQNSHFENREMTAQEAWMSARFDALRPCLKMAFRDGAEADAEALYLEYISDWKPSEYSQQPATPPKTCNNKKLWEWYWFQVAGIASLTKPN